MGIDLKQGGRGVNKSKKDTRSNNVYLRLLIKVRRIKLAIHIFGQKN